jgi:hypothetical protein
VTIVACGLRFAVCGLRFMVYGLQFVVCGLRLTSHPRWFAPTQHWAAGVLEYLR